MRTETSETTLPATFANRAHAGRLLATALAPWRASNPIVLALPRGGVPVAVPIAEALGAQLDVLVVRKLGVPSNPEFGMGAIVEDGTIVLEPSVVTMVGLDETTVKRISEDESREARRRVERYRAGHPLPSVAGRTVILVDDGVATGGTARAAARAVRRAGAKKVVLAVPVAAAESVVRLETEVDDLVALKRPHGLGAVGDWYDDFSQVSDQDVVTALRAAGR